MNTSLPACAFVLRRGVMLNELRTLSCPALALPGSRFCAVHQKDAPVLSPRPRVQRDLALDVLPWTQDDQQVFRAQAPKGRRRR